jgi:hypothetical protein
MCAYATAYPIHHLLARQATFPWRETTRKATHLSCAVLPRRWYPDYVWNVVDTYVEKLGDNLVRLSDDGAFSKNGNHGR